MNELIKTLKTSCLKDGGNHSGLNPEYDPAKSNLLLETFALEI